MGTLTFSTMRQSANDVMIFAGREAENRGNMHGTSAHKFGLFAMDFDIGAPVAPPSSVAVAANMPAPHKSQRGASADRTRAATQAAPQPPSVTLMGLETTAFDDEMVRCDWAPRAGSGW